MEPFFIRSMVIAFLIVSVGFCSSFCLENKLSDKHNGLFIVLSSIFMVIDAWIFYYFLEYELIDWIDVFFIVTSIVYCVRFLLSKNWWLKGFRFFIFFISFFLLIKSSDAIFDLLNVSLAVDLFLYFRQIQKSKNIRKGNNIFELSAVMAYLFYSECLTKKNKL